MGSVSSLQSSAQSKAQSSAQGGAHFEYTATAHCHGTSMFEAAALGGCSKQDQHASPDICAVERDH